MQPQQPQPPPAALGYQARDGTFWHMFARNQPATTPPRLRTGIVKGNGRQARTAKDAWDLFITPAMIDHIVKHTNQKAEENRKKYKRADRRDATYGDVDAEEMLAFFGLLYLAGVHKESHTNLNQLWATNGTGIELFQLVMSKERFRFLVRSLRFDDITTRDTRKKRDKLAAIRDIFEMFRRNCMDNYEPGEFVACDEMLEKFRGLCPFRQYIPRKPGRYGLKVQACCDVRDTYVYNLEPYAGTQPAGPYRQSNKPDDIVLRLVEPISNQAGRARVVTTDNWYTSLRLARELNNRNLSFVGTVRKNRVFVPKELSERRPINTTIFGYTDDATLLDYQPKKNRHVLMLTTVPEIMHELIAPQDAALRPEAILLYNKTKGAVDTVDKMKAAYDVARGTKRWNVVLWFAFMNMAGINALVIYRKNNASKIHRSSYLMDLIFNLVESRARRRLLITQTPNYSKSRIKEIFPRRPGDPAPPEEEELKDGLCYLCPASLNRKTKTQCSICAGYICRKDHIVHLCTACAKRTRRGG